MTSTAEITIEKPDFNKTKQPPGLAWKVSALTIVVGVGFLVSVAVASIALGLVLKQQSDIDGLNVRVAILEGRDTVKLTTDAVAPPGFQSVSLFNGEWAPGVQMPEERSDHQAVFCFGKIIILGGLNMTGEAVATTWEFDPIIETFATGKAAMPTARYRFGATCLEGRVYVAGGYPTKAAGDAGQCLSTVDVYDVATDTWSAAPPLSLARGDLALAVAEGTIFAMGGYGYEYPYPDPANEANEAYSPASGTWTTMMPLPGGGKGDISAAEIDGVIYVSVATASTPERRPVAQHGGWSWLPTCHLVLATRILRTFSTNPPPPRRSPAGGMARSRTSWRRTTQALTSGSEALRGWGERAATRRSQHWKVAHRAAVPELFTRPRACAASRRSCMQPRTTRRASLGISSACCPPHDDHSLSAAP
jgi:hypothetical protein